MREEDYKNAFQSVVMKTEMKERIINKCSNRPQKKYVSKGARALIAAACSVILFTGINAVTTHAYGFNILSRFYRFIQNDTQSVVEIHKTERREAFKDTTTTPHGSIDKNLSTLLEEYHLTNLVVPQKLSTDWTLTDSDFSYAGSSTDLKPSITFTISNGTDQIYASVDGGVSDRSAYQVGIDYVETKVVKDIEFLIVHLAADLTYENYLAELEALLLPIMQISAEEFYKTNTYAELGTEEAYQNFIKYRTFVDFSTGGYDYSYGLTGGIALEDFLDSLVYE